MSLRHVALFELREGVSRDDQRVIDAARLSAEHPHHIAEIRDWWCGFDTSHREIAADFMIMGIFDDADALQRYLVHEHHQRGVRAWGEVADWKIIDIDESIARTV